MEVVDDRRVVEGLWIGRREGRSQVRLEDESEMCVLL